MSGFYSYNSSPIKEAYRTYASRLPIENPVSSRVPLSCNNNRYHQTVASRLPAADSETMIVEVAFTFDATSLDGKQLVTFEELYDLSNPDKPKKVTEHKDIEDKGQTITFKEKPEVPEEPEKPETPQTPDTPHKTDSPKTGDSTNLYGLLVLLLTSGAGLAGIFFYKRRQTKKS